MEHQSLIAMSLVNFTLMDFLNNMEHCKGGFITFDSSFIYNTQCIQNFFHLMHGVCGVKFYPQGRVRCIYFSKIKKVSFLFISLPKVHMLPFDE